MAKTSNFPLIILAYVCCCKLLIFFGKGCGWGRQMWQWVDAWIELNTHAHSLSTSLWWCKWKSWFAPTAEIAITSCFSFPFVSATADIIELLLVYAIPTWYAANMLYMQSTFCSEVKLWTRISKPNTCKLLYKCTVLNTYIVGLLWFSMDLLKPRKSAWTLSCVVNANRMWFETSYKHDDIMHTLLMSLTHLLYYLQIMPYNEWVSIICKLLYLILYSGPMV